MNSKLLVLLALFISEPILAENLSLDQFLQQVEQQNLDFKIEAAKVEVLDAKSFSLGLPPPMLGLIKMTEEDGSSSTGFEISQMIPFPTKLFADRSARKYEFQAQKQLNLFSQKQILLNAKVSYLEHWRNQQKLALLQEKKSLLQNHLKLARSQARSDSFATIHLLKTESDLDLLDAEIEFIKQSIFESQLKLAALINADITFKIIAIEPEVSKVPTLMDLKESHFFKAKELSLESLKAKKTEANSSWLPDFSIKYKQMDKTLMNSPYNEVMVGVTLPFLFFWEPYSVSKQAGQELLMGEYELSKEKRSRDSERSALLARTESLKRQLDILIQKLIPRAEKRMKLAHNIVPRDLETLQDHRETMEVFPELKLKALDLRLEFEKSVAELEKYISLKDSANE